MPAKKKTSKTSKTLDEDSTKLMENIESANKKLQEQGHNEPVKEESSTDQEKRIKKQAQLKKQKQKQKENEEQKQKENEMKEQKQKENEQNNREMSQQEMQNRRIEMERMRKDKIRNSDETLNVSVPFLLNIRDLLISITPRTNWQSNELLNAGMILEHLNRINSLFMEDNLPGAPESTGTS